MTALKKLLGINRALQQLLNTTPGGGNPEVTPRDPVEVQVQASTQRENVEERPAGSEADRK